MSYEEYNDMFIDAQTKKSKYHMYTFDIVNSKTMLNRYEAQKKMILLASKIYQDITNIETKLGHKILVMEEGFMSLEDNKPLFEFGFKREPFIYGDSFGFTIYKDTLSKEDIMDIYNRNMSKLNIDFEFHLADGYYETNDYTEGNKKYFRGYCIQKLVELHKKPI
jgi:hypothetical protein